MKLFMLGLLLALGLQLSGAEEFTKCTGVNVGLTNICSKLAKMDCYNAGGGCCASNSDGTGTISVAEKTSEELCGYCFTGQPDTLEATLEAISTAQGGGRRGKGKGRSGPLSTMQGKRGRGGRKGKGGKGGKRRGRGRGRGKGRGRGRGRGRGKGAGAGAGVPTTPPTTM